MQFLRDIGIFYRRSGYLSLVSNLWYRTELAGQLVGFDSRRRSI
jgi:hypothetical protein